MKRKNNGPMQALIVAALVCVATPQIAKADSAAPHERKSAPYAMFESTGAPPQDETVLTKPAQVPEEVKRIVNTYYPENYEISQWVLKPWIEGDLNGDGESEIAVLIRDKRERLNHGNAYPTHVAIFSSLKKNPTIKNIRSNLLVKMQESMPAQSQDSFRINKNSKYLKVLGCPQPVAIEFYEEAATSFFLCWDGKSYKFFRDPTDEP